MLKRSMGMILGVLALAFIFGGAVHAQTTPAPKKATAAKTATAKKAEIASTGTITSVDATHLMLTRKVAGKDQPMTLMLTPETKKTGDLAPGARVSVRYHMENSDMVASSVRVMATTAAKAKAGTPKAKKAS
jgi:hypothetical protein